MECDNRIARILSFIGDTFRNFERNFRILKNNSGTLDDVNLDDLTFVKEFFAKNFLLHKKPTSEYELLLKLEEMIVTYLAENAEKMSSIPYREFVTSIGVEINKIATSLRYDFNMKIYALKIITAGIDIALLKSLQSDTILQKTAMKKPKDLQIICEVEANQREVKKWNVLATLDKNDFLNNADHIEKVAKVICADPLYLPQVLKRLESMPFLES